MEIRHQFYQKLLHAFPAVPPEAGAILGGQNGTITHFAYDSGILCYESAIYTPSTDRLNRVIQEWAGQDISFYGIAHSHPPGQVELSISDMAYIMRIMDHMPDSIQTLFFPLVIPGERIIPFVAHRASGTISISPDTVLLK